KLIVEGRAAAGPYRSEVSTADQESANSAALRHLWARQRIAALSDQEALEGGAAQKAAITELGLKYSLLTQHTSFIAVDHIVRNSNPALSPSVDQPSPLPEGVSNLAIGAEVPSTPEPAAWLALLVALLAALALATGLRAFMPAGRASLPLAGLAVLALPLVSSLQFYAGYPLRVLTAQLSTWGLQLAGVAAARSGSAMTVEGRLIVVDAPCSGVQMVWMAYFCACAVAAFGDMS